jgi:hypothetical protein
MARKVITRKVRKGAPRKNVLSVRPFGRSLRKKIRESVATIEQRRQSKVTLTTEEKKLVKATLEPLRQKKQQPSKLKPGKTAFNVHLVSTTCSNIACIVFIVNLLSSENRH